MLQSRTPALKELGKVTSRTPTGKSLNYASEFGLDSYSSCLAVCESKRVGRSVFGGVGVIERT